MRKLTETEYEAMCALFYCEPIVPGDRDQANFVFDALVKLKLVRVEPTDDGPAYVLSPQGRQYMYSDLVDG